MLAILLGSILFLFALHCFIRYRRVGRLLSLIPGPREYPIVGNMHHLQVDDEHLIKELWRISNEYYPIYKVWSFFISSITLLDPDDIQELLKSKEHIEKAALYKYLRPWLSYGLLTSGGQKLAMNELKLMVAFILHNFELEPVDELDDVTFMADLTLTSCKPLRVKFIPIT
ncbi:hypothetical protein M0804_012768 [Polistes exclamans]|nr:hypothetical protein M0804_012768 [Polistes exclamans]